MDSNLISLLIVIGLIALQLVGGKKKRRGEEAKRPLKIERVQEAKYDDDPFESLLAQFDKVFAPDGSVPEGVAENISDSPLDFVEDNYFENQYASKELLDKLNLELSSTQKRAEERVRYVEPELPVMDGCEEMVLDPKMFIIYSEIAKPKHREF